MDPAGLCISLSARKSKKQGGLKPPNTITIPQILSTVNGFLSTLCVNLYSVQKHFMFFGQYPILHAIHPRAIV